MDLATTEEGDDYAVKEPPNVPTWRIMAGNCAAGATAGAAVEAGTLPSLEVLQLIHHCSAWHELPDYVAA